MSNNFNDKISKIERLLSDWAYRYLSPFGKVTVVKSLGVSKLSHIALRPINIGFSNRFLGAKAPLELAHVKKKKKKKKWNGKVWNIITLPLWHEMTSDIARYTTIL